MLVSTLWSDETLNQINLSFPPTEKKSVFFFLNVIKHGDFAFLILG